MSSGPMSTPIMRTRNLWPTPIIAFRFYEIYEDILLDFSSEISLQKATYLYPNNHTIVRQIFAIARSVAGLSIINDGYDGTLEVFRYKTGGHFAAHTDAGAEDEPWEER